MPRPRLGPEDLYVADQLSEAGREFVAGLVHTEFDRRYDPLFTDGKLEPDQLADILYVLSELERMGRFSKLQTSVLNERLAGTAPTVIAERYGKSSEGIRFARTELRNRLDIEAWAVRSTRQLSDEDLYTAHQVDPAGLARRNVEAAADESYRRRWSRE